MTVIVEEAQQSVPELIARATAGEEVVIRRDETPVAKLVAAPPPTTNRGCRVVPVAF
jgi:antitoxin (DNA-binding transcriptional repressor) of toxin-antitoxin stability system